MYKQGSKQKLRFTTSRGSLTTEQLWDLSLTELDALAVSLEEDYKESGKKSFLTAKSEKDKTAKLRFDVVLDVLTTKVDEAEVARDKAERKAKNQKILSLISEKQDENLKKKSVKELERMLEED